MFLLSEKPNKINSLKINESANKFIIKNYLRTTMGQEKFFCLAIILIENEICENLDYGDLMVTCPEATECTFS